MGDEGMKDEAAALPTLAVGDRSPRRGTVEQSDGKDPPRRHFRPKPLRSDDDDGNGKLWDAHDVADFLKVSPSWVYKAAADGNLPVVRLPGLTSVRFIPKLIKAFVAGTWKPTQVIPLKAG